jgi:hypothetical protein
MQQAVCVPRLAGSVWPQGKHGSSSSREESATKAVLVIGMTLPSGVVATNKGTQCAEGCVTRGCCCATRQWNSNPDTLPTPGMGSVVSVSG